MAAMARRPASRPLAARRTPALESVGGGPLASRPAGPLSGEASVPGDKSLSHRALVIGALAVGETTVEGLLEADDVMRTARAVEALGAPVRRAGPGRWRIQGVGVGGLAEPADLLDLGNAGTAARLLIGVAAAHPFTTHFTGDESLRARPMGGVAAPLEAMGARIVARSGCRLPLAVVGTASPVPIDYRLPAPSAQVKSAVLLAGLHAPGETTVVEPEPTRDHTERLLRHFGAEIRVGEEDGARAITVVGQPELTAQAVTIPGDVSAAAFLVVAALVGSDSAVTLRGVGVNPLRTGLIETLEAMGADLRVDNRREEGLEPVADLVVRASALEGVEVPAERAPRMIDDYPVLAVAAACARGRTVMRGLRELKVKESDRLAGIARGLEACGVEVEVEGDDLFVTGCGGPPPGGGLVKTLLDHRIAMAFLVLGAVARKPVRIDDGAPIATSFPGFVGLMNGLGAKIG